MRRFDVPSTAGTHLMVAVPPLSVAAATLSPPSCTATVPVADDGETVTVIEFGLPAVALVGTPEAVIELTLSTAGGVSQV